MRRLVACSSIALLLVGCESAQPKKAEEASPPASAATAAAQPAPAPTPAPTPAPPAPVAPAGPPPGQEPVTAAPQASRVLVIRPAQANFRAAPGTSARIVAVLRKGTRVEVLEARNQWYRVKLADGREGWIAESVAAAPAD